MTQTKPNPLAETAPILWCSCRCLQCQRTWHGPAQPKPVCPYDPRHKGVVQRFDQVVLAPSEQEVR